MAIEIVLLNNSNPNKNNTYFNNKLNISGATRISGGYWPNASKVLLRPTGTHPHLEQLAPSHIRLLIFLEQGDDRSIGQAPVIAISRLA